MSSVQDLSLALKNLQIEYKHAIIVPYKGSHIEASVANILWLERQLLSADRRNDRVHDVNGYPCPVENIEELLELLLATSLDADRRFIIESQRLQTQITSMYRPGSFPDTKESEE
jgi:hypothetical protein